MDLAAAGPLPSEPGRCYRALASRDPRFDGRFFVGVRTTGVYCRPICPAPTPKRANVSFFPCAAAAEAAGFRPCRRCRPESAPGTPAWLGSSATVARGLRLIAAGALDGAGVEGLARSLGVGARQVRRLFDAHLGASPLAVARTRRVHFARRLIDETALPMSELALAAGFASIRHFNHSIRSCFGRSPSELRRAARGPRPQRGQTLRLRLAYRPPLDWSALLAFLAARAIPGVERVAEGGYRRTVRLGRVPGRLSVRALPGAAQLEVEVDASPGAPLLEVADRVRVLFDLGADPLRIAADLGHDPDLAPCLSARPGLRVPGAWDGFELAVRAVLGQQVTVRGASTLAGRLVRRLGEPLDAPVDGLTHLFPAPERVAGAELDGLGLPAARAEALRALARAVASGDLALEPGADPERARAVLGALPGVGEWTAEVVAMRALGEPDAFPAGDLGLRRALAGGAPPLSAAELARRAEAWRPWRAYAALHLWHADASATGRDRRGRARRSGRPRARGTGAAPGRRRARRAARPRRAR
jgi:AraC family transcriptional regulator of adaptative response / DNA-3-methyladenine glycosylase II